MMNVVDPNFDTTLQVAGRVEVTGRSAPAGEAGGAPSDEVAISWSLKSGPATCFWIQRKAPGGDYTAVADFVLRPDQLSVRDWPGPLAGEYCYRIFAVSARGPSRPVESCAAITSPRAPVVFDGPGPGAPSAGGGTGTDGSSPELGVLLLGAGCLASGAFVLGFPGLRTSGPARLTPPAETVPRR
jgi:hypothetical protein